MKILPYITSPHSQPNTDPARMSSRITSITPDLLGRSAHGVVIFGLADDTGVQNVGGRPGARLGPEAFREKFYRLSALPLPCALYDLGNLPTQKSIEETHERARECIRLIHAAGHLPLIIGGGHDLAFPEAAALLDHFGGRQVQFINLDAHLDLRNTASGITSGSPWYLLAESQEFATSKSRLIEIGVQRHCNSQDLIAYAGKRKIEILWLDELRARKIELKKYLLSRLTKKPSLVSLDIDGVRWSDAPGCSAPQNTGFSAEEAIEMCWAAGKSKTVRSFGIYELSPPLDRDNQTAMLVARCAHAFLQGFATRFKVASTQVQLKGNGGKKRQGSTQRRRK